MNKKPKEQKTLPVNYPAQGGARLAESEEILHLLDNAFINPLTDFGFKRLLASEANKDILIRFLNAFLSDTIGVITDLTYLPTEHIGIAGTQKQVRFDIYCQIQDGSHVIIEMQNAWQKFYANRSLMYSSRAISRNVRRGDKKYDIPRVVSFNIMGFNMPEFKGRDRYFWRVQLKDNDNEIFSDRMELYFVELPKFAAQKNSWDFADERVKWLYTFTHIWRMTEDEVNNLRENDPIFCKFYEESKLSNLTDMEKEEYAKSVLDYEDVQEALECVRENSLKQGFDRGVEQGFDRGVKKGRVEGREQGREEATNQLVRSLLDNGFDVPTIVKVTGLAEEAILAIKEGEPSHK